MTHDHHGVPFRSLAEHLAEVVAVGAPTPSEVVPTQAALGLVLAADVAARLPVPPFSNSAMDGFITHRSSLVGSDPWELPVSGDIPAGRPPVDVAAGTAVRIMTGAPIPVATEATAETAADLVVIPVEDTDVPAGAVPLPERIVVSAVSDRNHIRHQGENCQIGDVVARAGTLVDAGVIASLLSTGITEVLVHRRPKVAVISAGDELVTDVAAPADLRPGAIPDSNRPMLTNLLHEHGVYDVHAALVPDDTAAFQAELASLSREYDAIVTAGGVSAGAFDVVKEAFDSPTDGLAAAMWFGPVQIQPGKPQGLGTVNGTPVICLPGNPVSSFVCFYLFVLPLVRVLAGVDPQQAVQHPRLRLPAHDPIKAPRGRDLFIPCSMNWSAGDAYPVIPGGMGSHFVASLVDATALIHLPTGHGAVQPGDMVSVILLKV
ncbi:MAG: molybdopterin molybdotransferase MoeA [Corynebacterium sp.]|nr:molybdopterin molybdotransferase MoeA [Corynebacterium sp.]